MTVASIKDMNWRNRAGIWFGTGETHTYRASKVFFGTAPSNWTYQTDCRPHIDEDGNEDTDWSVLREANRGDRLLKDVKMWCFYHDQNAQREQLAKK